MRDKSKKDELISKKLLVILFIVQIVLASSAGIIGFSDYNTGFGRRFMETLQWFKEWDIGRGTGMYETHHETMEVLIPLLTIDFGREGDYLIYNYRGIRLPQNSRTAIDVLLYAHTAEKLETLHASDGSPGPTLNPLEHKLHLRTEFLKELDLTMLVEINGVKEDPGRMIQWQIFYWNVKKQSWEFIPIPASKLMLKSGDTILFLHAEFGGVPLDCCTGGWEYSIDQPPPKK